MELTFKSKIHIIYLQKQNVSWYPLDWAEQKSIDLQRDHLFWRTSSHCAQTALFEQKFSYFRLFEIFLKKRKREK